jgi:hypothetical protein
VSEQTTNRSFDDLARAMAEGSLSRRRALKLFAGTAIAALIPSRALADDDDECVRVCHVPFDRETEECDFANAETRCVSRRERRRHLEKHPCDCRGSCRNCLTSCLPNGGTCSANDQCCSGNCVNGTCACKGLSSACNNNSECCSGFCNQLGICDQNRVTCTCQDGGSIVGLCTMAACTDTTALNQFCNSFCSSAERGSGVAGDCLPICDI